MRTIWTVGHSNRSLQEFLEMISRNRIECVVDVRSFPTSRWGHFKRDNLASALKEIGVSYVWMGETLGGFRRGGYVEWMKTASFSKGLAELLRLAGEKRVAIMCSERFPWRCHRNILSRRLAAEKVRVVHILELERIYEQKGSSAGLWLM
jgi:uncharacterized protein (DUF488 family)